MPNDIEIAKAALVRLGEVPIDSFDEETETARTLNVVYDQLTENLLSLYPWRFTLRKRQLARLVTAPINEWRYSYQLPSDRLTGPYAVFDTASIGARPLQRYEIFEDKLYADEAKIWIDYQAKPATTTWPPYFVELVTLALASEIALPVTGSTSLSAEMAQKAWGTPSENRTGGQYRQARAKDSQQQPPQEITSFPLVDARFS